MTKILEIGNIVVDHGPMNYTVYELKEVQKGKTKGELVPRDHKYYPTLEQALMNVRERLRAREYDGMVDLTMNSLVRAVLDADKKMEKLIQSLKERRT